MRWACLSVTFLFLAACSRPVPFELEVDERISSADLVLNGKTSNFERHGYGPYKSEWNGSDASGQINILYPDGSRTTCQVGYVTHGITEPQRFRLENKACKQVIET